MKGLYGEADLLDNMEEVRDPDVVAELCSALSHPNRVHLYRILQEEGDTYLSDLVSLASHALPKPLNYMTVKHHVHRMEEADVVDLGKRDGQFFVELTRPNLRIVEAPVEADQVDAENEVEVRR